MENNKPNKHPLIPATNTQISKVGNLIKITDKLLAPSQTLVPFLKKNGKYIYVDFQTMKPVITKEYDCAWPFKDGLAQIGLNAKKGFIDKYGREVIPIKFSYNQIGGNNESLVSLQEENDKWGVYDLNGKVVVDFKYDYIGKFFKGISPVKLNDKWGFINKHGNFVTSLKYPLIGMGPKTLWNIENNKIITDDSSLKLHLKYGSVFNEGFAPVGINEKWGFIDMNGIEIVPLLYDKVKYFTEGLAPVKKKNKWGFVNTHGDLVIPTQFDNDNREFIEFENGFVQMSVNEKWGSIDKNGNIFIEFIYDNVGSFSEGLAAVELNGKYGFIDVNGNMIIQLKYDFAGKFSEGLACVRIKNKWGYIDKKGNEVIAISLEYFSVNDFHDDMAIVGNKNGYHGFIDKKGNEVIPLLYRFAEDFNNELSFVGYGGLSSGVINKQGAEVIPLIYYFKDNTFNDGIVLANNFTCHICIDKEGREFREK